KRIAAGECHGLCARIKSDRARAQAKLDRLLVVVLRWSQKDPLGAELAPKDLLRQGRALVRSIGLGADEDHAPVEALLPNRFDGATAGQIAPDDDKRLLIRHSLPDSLFLEDTVLVALDATIPPSCMIVEATLGGKSRWVS